MKIRPRWLAAFALVLVVSAARAWAAGSWSTVEQLEKPELLVVGTASDRLIAVEPRTGHRRWSIRVPNATGIKMACSPDTVFTVDAEGTVEAVEGETGLIRWTVKTGLAVKPPPSLIGGSLYVRGQKGDAGHLFALDPASGTLRWKRPWNVRHLRRQGDLVLVTTEETLKAPIPPVKEPTAIRVRLVRPSDGSEEWVSAPSPGTLKAGARMVGSDRVLFQTLYTDTSPEVNGQKAPPAGTPTRRLVVASQKDGSEVWKRDIPLPMFGPPQLSDDALLLVSLDKGALSLYDLATGELRWQKTFQPSSPSSATSPGPPTIWSVGVLEGEHLALYSSREKDFELLSVDPRTGAETGRLAGGGSLDGPPTLAGGGLLVPLTAIASRDARPRTSTRERAHEALFLDPLTLQRKWSLALRDGLGDGGVTELPESQGLLLSDGDDLVRVDPSTGGAPWRVTVEEGVVAGPIFKNNLMLVGDKNQVLSAFHLDSGKLAWSTPTKLWFAEKKTVNLFFVVVLLLLIGFFIQRARSGQKLFIRRIAGLNAVDEAVGRATEMGRPVLFLPGMHDVDDIQTLSALSILGHVAQRAAEYQTPILVPCRFSVTMSTAQEVVKEAYLRARQPDAYQAENIRYLTDDEFGYAAGVDGIMVREQPAANFYMGQFYAESLIFAETGYSTGAIQIAGTTATTQLPFLVAACDYTLIGEELFAASAYLSQNPLEVGSLKGQDWAKALIMLLIAGSCILYIWFPQVKTWLAQ